jgi:hypothetical protein
VAERWCRVCGRRFLARTGQHVYCTPVCRERARATVRLLKPARYGGAHQRARAAALRLVRAGKARCSRCGLAIGVDEEFDLDHADDGLGYLGVSHVGCNRSAPHRRRPSPAVPPSVPADDPGRGVFYGPMAQAWSRPWFEWR